MVIPKLLWDLHSLLCMYLYTSQYKSASKEIYYYLWIIIPIAKRKQYNYSSLRSIIIIINVKTDVTKWRLKKLLIFTVYNNYYKEIIHTYEKTSIIIYIYNYIYVSMHVNVNLLSIHYNYDNINYHAFSIILW